VIRPIVLVVVQEGVQPLVIILIHDLGLTVSLRVICCREADFHPDNTAELLLKPGYELGASIRDYRVGRAEIAVYVVNE
jgi:hypothetical protein